MTRPRKREYLYIAVVVLLYAIASNQDYADAKVTEAIVQEHGISHYAELVAGCMNGDSIIWTDPHTKMEMAAFCEVVPLGRMQ